MLSHRKPKRSTGRDADKQTDGQSSHDRAGMTEKNKKENENDERKRRRLTTEDCLQHNRRQIIIAEFLFLLSRKKKKCLKSSANGRQLATFLFNFDKMNYEQTNISV